MLVLLQQKITERLSKLPNLPDFVDGNPKTELEFKCLFHYAIISSVHIPSVCLIG